MRLFLTSTHHPAATSSPKILDAKNRNTPCHTGQTGRRANFSIRATLRCVDACSGGDSRVSLNTLLSSTLILDEYEAIILLMGLGRRAMLLPAENPEHGPKPLAANKRSRRA